jgi:hypothetical protein
MILALDKHAALYVFSSAQDAERELEAIDVQQGEFEFCDATGQRYAVVFTIPPTVSRLGPLRSVDVGAFTLTAQDEGVDSTLPERFVERAVHIEHTSIPAFTSIEALRDEIRKRA